MTVHAYQAAKAELEAVRQRAYHALSQINRLRVTNLNGRYTGVHSVTVSLDMVVIHLDDEQFVPLKASVDDGEVYLYLKNYLTLDEAIEHQLVSEGHRRALNEAQAKFQKYTDELVEWNQFLNLAQKFGVLVSKDTVAV